MFDLGNNEGVQGYQDRIKRQILGSYKGTEAALIKGISIEQFEAKYPTDKFERYSYEGLNKAKDELSKAENFNGESFNKHISTELEAVVIQHQDQKKLMYVKEKKA